LALWLVDDDLDVEARSAVFDNVELTDATGCMEAVSLIDNAVFKADIVQ
jgi:hypothetical protein